MNALIVVMQLIATIYLKMELDMVNKIILASAKSVTLKYEENLNQKTPVVEQVFLGIIRVGRIH